MKPLPLMLASLACAALAHAADPAVVVPPAAPAGDVARVARDLSVRHKAALVQISGVLKVEGMPGQMEAAEQPLEAIGTVVEASGLTVVSATTINPIKLLKSMSMGADTAGMGGADLTQVQATPGQLKIRRADGSEVPARLVLQDDDVDLAFLVPEPPPAGAKPAPFAFVSMAGGREAQVMDEVIGLGQLGKMFNWEVSAGVSRIMARTVKPRTFYALAPGYTGGPGTPVFSAEGHPVGLVVLRSQAGEVMEAAIVVPAADVLDMAAQANEAAARRRNMKKDQAVEPSPAPKENKE